jgi:hypothetical protein
VRPRALRHQRRGHGPAKRKSGTGTNISLTPPEIKTSCSL